MSHRTKFAAIVLVCLMAGSADSSVITTTKINSVLVGEVYGNLAFISVTVKPTQGVPSCQTNADLSYVFDHSTPLGKATLDVVMAAYLAQRDVYLNGYSTCSLFSNVETLRQIWSK